MLNPIEINFKLDKTIKRAHSTEMMIKSHDINVIEFHISFDGLELTADHTVKVLSVFNDTKSQTNVNCDIADGKAIYRPDTSVISQYEYVQNYVYVYHGEQSLDVRLFTYIVDSSEIDKTAIKVKTVYDQTYAELLTEFEARLQDYKDSLPQASDLRAEVDVILDKFKTDSQSAIDFLGEVSTAVEIAEASRVENEYERVQAETERKEAELLREENYEQLIDTAIVEADVVEKVDSKVTELTPQINSLTTQLAQKVGLGVKAELEDLSENVLSAIEGGEGTSFNLLSIPQPGSVTPTTLADNYNHKGRLTASDDLNSIFRSGTYYAIDCANRPTNDIYNVTVNYFDNRYVTQLAVKRSDARQVYIRSRDMNNGDLYPEWLRINTGIVRSEHLSNDFEYAGTLSTEDLNTVVKAGTYVANVGLPNRPPNSADSSALIRVFSFGASILIQEYIQYSDTSKIWRRRIRPSNDDFGDWFSIQTNGIAPSDPSKPFLGKKIAMFGDSIVANYGIPDTVAGLTGATVYNFATGGTRMGYHSTAPYDAFSMYRLADAVATGDFTLQDAAINNPVVSPGYAQLKITDFSTVDYVIISYGTNDFGGGNWLGDYPDTEQWYRNVNDATSYAIETIATAYPHIKLLFTTPIFRNRTTENGLNSDDNPNAGGKFLIEFSDLIKETAEKEHVPVLDLFRTSNINKYNQSYFLADELHPTPAGANHLARMISSGLAATY